MKDYLRYNELIRKILRRLYKFLPIRLKEKIEDFLFPDDCIITFIKKEISEKK